MIQQARLKRDFVREHLQALHIGSEVTKWFRKTREPQVLQVTPENVLAVLHGAGINCVLMGTHGINVYRDQARATQDVDVLVTKRDVRKTVRILEATFPYLEVIDNASVARFLDPVSQKIVLDVLKPSSRAIQAVFRHTVAIGDSYRIPDLEMALVSKFVAMISPTRRLDKRQTDAGDFTNIVLHHRAAIDLPKLRRLAASVQPGGASLIQAMLDAIKAGRPVPL